VTGRFDHNCAATPPFHGSFSATVRGKSRTVVAAVVEGRPCSRGRIPARRLTNERFAQSFRLQRTFSRAMEPSRPISHRTDELAQS
jgi:hypothetical protein